jgi:hypothetical protein
VKQEPLYTVDGNVNWYNHHGKEYGDSLKLQIELPCGQVTSPGHIPEGM